MSSLANWTQRLRPREVGKKMPREQLSEKRDKGSMVHYHDEPQQHPSPPKNVVQKLSKEAAVGIYHEDVWVFPRMSSRNS